MEISAETRAAMLVAGNYIEEKRDVGGQWETQGRLLETIGTANAIFGGTRLDSWTIRFCGGFFLKRRRALCTAWTSMLILVMVWQWNDFARHVPRTMGEK